MKNNDKLVATICLLVVAASWGFNFSIMKLALPDIGPLLYLGIRFMIAAACMAIIFHQRLRKVNRNDIKGGVIVGLFLCSSFSLQVIGLQFTTPGKAGFISNASVIFVPFIYWVVIKKSPGVANFLGAFIAFVGLGLLSITSNFTIGWGDSLMFLSALLFSGQIVSVGIFAKDTDPYVLASIQIFVTGIGCMLLAILFEPMQQVQFSLNVIFAIGFGVVFCTMLAFILQSIAQKVASTSRTAIILCSEAVFALFFSLIFKLDILTPRGILGSVLVFAGFLICESNLNFKKKTLTD